MLVVLIHGPPPSRMQSNCTSHFTTSWPSQHWDGCPDASCFIMWARWQWQVSVLYILNVVAGMRVIWNSNATYAIYLYVAVIDNLWWRFITSSTSQDCHGCPGASCFIMCAQWQWQVCLIRIECGGLYEDDMDLHRAVGRMMSTCTSRFTTSSTSWCCDRCPFPRILECGFHSDGKSVSYISCMWWPIRGWYEPPTRRMMYTCTSRFTTSSTSQCCDRCPFPRILECGDHYNCKSVSYISCMWWPVRGWYGHPTRRMIATLTSRFTTSSTS